MSEAVLANGLDRECESFPGLIAALDRRAHDILNRVFFSAHTPDGSSRAIAFDQRS
jgi:hypothetical protein